MSEKTYGKASLLASDRWSATDKLLLERALKDEGKYTLEQAQALLKKMKTKAVD